MTGRIVRLRQDRHFGFLQSDTGGPDLFFHQGAMPEWQHFTRLAVGTRVSFEEVPSEKGPRADVVRLLDLAETEGTFNRARLTSVDTGQLGFVRSRWRRR